MAGQEIAVVLKLIADEFKKELSASKGVLGDFMGALRDWKTQLAAGSGVLVALAKSTASYAEETKNAALATGTTTQGFQALAYAAKQSNVDQDAFRNSLVHLNRSLVEAFQKSGDARDAFQGLNISVKSADGSLRYTDSTLLELADRFKALGPGAEASSYAVKLFGKAGSEMLPFLLEGRTGIEGMMQRARELGIVLSDEATAQAAEFNSAMGEMTAAANGLKYEIGNGLIPIITKLMTVTTDLGSTWLGKLFKLMVAGWKEILIVVEGAALSIEAVIDRISGKIDQSQLLEKLKTIREDTGAAIFFADNPDAQVRVNKSAPRPTPGGTLDSDVKERQAALDAERKYAEQIIEVRREMQEAALQVEEAHLQRRVSINEIGGEALVDEQVSLERRKLETQQESLTKLLQIESIYYQELQGISGRSHDDRLKAEAAHAEKVIKVVSDMFKVRQQLTVADDKAAMDRAKAQGIDQAGSGKGIVYNANQAYQASQKAAADRVTLEQASLAQIETSHLFSYYQISEGRIRIFEAMRARDLQAETTNEARRALINAEYDQKIDQERQALRVRQLDDEVARTQASLETIKSFYTSTSVEIAQAQIAVFDAMRARDLADTKLSEAQKDKIRAEYDAKEKRETAKMDSLSGLAQGMSDYVRDTDSAFGLMRDMARSTAQAMQGFFSKFFFDLLEGKITSLKDLMRGVLDFVKQLLVQVAAQLATIMALKLMLGGASGGTGLLGGLFAREGGEVFKRYRLGGPIVSNGDHIPIMAARGEYVMSRRGVEFLDRINQGIHPNPSGAGGNVTVNVHGVPAGHRVSAQHSLNLKEHVINLILENVAENGAMRRSFA